MYRSASSRNTRSLPKPTLARGPDDEEPLPLGLDLEVADHLQVLCVLVLLRHDGRRPAQRPLYVDDGVERGDARVTTLSRVEATTLRIESNGVRMISLDVFVNLNKHRSTL